jgi:hypothetical protein
LNVALRNIGYDGTVHVPHGFRATASTLLRELQFEPELVELQRRIKLRTLSCL